MTKTILAAAVGCSLLVPPAILGQDLKPDRVDADYRLFGPFPLLRRTTVQSELKLSEDQIAKVKERGKEISDIYRKNGVNVTGKSPEEQLRLRRAAVQPVLEASEKTMREILTAEQVARLREVFYQVCGFGAFSDVDAAFPSLDSFRHSLSLSKEQRETLTTLEREYRNSKAAIFVPGSNMPIQERLEKAVALQKAYGKKALDLLTSEQKVFWNSAIGKPFDMDTFLRN